MTCGQATYPSVNINTFKVYVGLSLITIKTLHEKRWWMEDEIFFVRTIEKGKCQKYRMI